MNRRRLGALGIGLLLVLLAELIARVLPDPTPPARGIVLNPDPTRIWALGEPPPDDRGPPFYRLSREGNRAVHAPGPAGAPLLLSTGDSSIFGDGLPDGKTLHDQLQVVLNARSISARVGTLAVPGYSTVQTLAALQEVGWEMQPHTLIVGNLWSDSNLDAFRDADLLRAAGSPMARVERLLVHSALFRQTRMGVNRALGRPAARKIAWPTPGQRGVRRVPLADYARNLSAMFDGARERGVGVVVLTLANAPMLQDGLQSSQEWAPYFAVQSAVAEAHHVPRVEALSIYRSSGLPSRALFQDELHPTADACRLLAEGVADALVQAGWPARAPVASETAPVIAPSDPFDGMGTLGGPSVQMDLLDGGG
jgi:hypothetical protein